MDSSVILVVIGWVIFGALLGTFARGIFVVHRKVGLIPAIGSGVAGAVTGGILTNLALGLHVFAALDSSWIGGALGALVGLAILAAVTTHRSRAAHVR